MNLDDLTDEELIRRAHAAPASEAGRLTDALFRRYQPKVAGWCLGLADNPSDAADLAQEIFLRVHRSLAKFRFESRFSTWLYTIARRTAINQNQAERRKAARQVQMDAVPEPVGSAPGAEALLGREQILKRLHRTMCKELQPLEAQTIYLHYVDGLTLPAITRLLDCRNKSGAKALLVSGMRKLRRHYGPWLARQERHTSANP